MQHGSNWLVGQGAYWLPLVSLPALAIDRMPGPVCATAQERYVSSCCPSTCCLLQLRYSREKSSSGNVRP
jgi:hypothetical protein